MNAVRRKSGTPGRPSVDDVLGRLDEEVRLLHEHVGGLPRAVEADSIAGVGLDARAGYASNTKVSWERVPGCSGTRYLYGNGEDWTVAPVVLATCRT